MFAYIVRRLALMIPTLFGIMLVNFLVIQAAPGGPVEQMIAQIQGQAVQATARFAGGGGRPAGAGYCVSTLALRASSVRAFSASIHQVSSCAPRVGVSAGRPNLSQ